MAANGIQGAKRRGKPWRTTKPDPAAKRPPDLVNRDFTVIGPDRDIQTELRALISAFD